MTTKNKNQSQNQLKGKMKKSLPDDSSDILSLSKLYEALVKASITLEKIFFDLGINMERIGEAKKLIDTEYKVWKFEYAKEFLDIVIANAALGKPQILTSNGWFVQVTPLTEKP